MRALAMGRILERMRLARLRHVNYATFRRFAQCLEEMDAPPLIVETGSCMASNSSTEMLSAIAIAGGGRFDTVDVDKGAYARAQAIFQSQYSSHENLRAHCGDSVAFLRTLDVTAWRPNAAYLDSYDLSPELFAASAKHGLAEFEALVPKLEAALSYILIDDTPVSRAIFQTVKAPDYMRAVDAHVAAHRRLPGKGELVVEAVKNDPRFTILAWEHQLLLRYQAE